VAFLAITKLAFGSPALVETYSSNSVEEKGESLSKDSITLQIIWFFSWVLNIIITYGCIKYVHAPESNFYGYLFAVYPKSPLFKLDFNWQII